MDFCWTYVSDPWKGKETKGTRFQNRDPYFSQPEGSQSPSGARVSDARASARMFRVLAYVIMVVNVRVDVCV